VLHVVVLYGYRHGESKGDQSGAYMTLICTHAATWVVEVKCPNCVVVSTGVLRVGAHQCRQVGFSLRHKTVAVSIAQVDSVQSVVKISQYRHLFCYTNCNTCV